MDIIESQIKALLFAILSRTNGPFCLDLSK